MCGRAAQTLQTVQHAAQGLLCRHGGDDFSLATSTTIGTSNPSCNDIIAASTINDSCRTAPLMTTTRDNFNIAPGHDTIVFYASSSTTSTTTNTSTRDITFSPLTWGLCPSDGTRNNPLPEGPSKHFSNLMFNARAETLYSKKTFSQLALCGQTCLWAVDGYFEWKEDQDNVLKKGGGKQPYFVKGKHGMPLYIPGLWHKVKTGKWIQRNGGTRTREKEEEEYIETFTIITTEACDALKWLHGRQPILLFDLELARKWLCLPSPIVLEEMVNHSKLMGGEECHGGGTVSNQEETPKTKEDWMVQWYPVTKQMSKIGYGGQDCITPIKIDKVASVKSFFMNASKMGHSKKHTLEQNYKEKGQDAVCKNDSPVKKSKGNNVGGGGGQGVIQKFFNDSKEKYNSSTTPSGQSPGRRIKITPENNGNNNLKKKGPLDAFFFKSNQR